MLRQHPALRWAQYLFAFMVALEVLGHAEVVLAVIGALAGFQAIRRYRRG